MLRHFHDKALPVDNSHELFSGKMPPRSKSQPSQPADGKKTFKTPVSRSSRSLPPPPQPLQIPVQQSEPRAPNLECSPRSGLEKLVKNLPPVQTNPSNWIRSPQRLSKSGASSSKRLRRPANRSSTPGDASIYPSSTSTVSGYAKAGTSYASKRWRRQANSPTAGENLQRTPPSTQRSTSPSIYPSSASTASGYAQASHGRARQSEVGAGSAQSSCTSPRPGANLLNGRSYYE